MREKEKVASKYIVISFIMSLSYISTALYAYLLYLRQQRGKSVLCMV